LSRKYAYQVVLAEELQRCGVSLVILKAPAGETADDRLLEQFRGMIAEYERAQILELTADALNAYSDTCCSTGNEERSRRGKRHKAQAGVVSVLSAAPYGYRYIKKSATAEACYEVIEAEAEVVHTGFDLYARAGLSINAIARHLNQQPIATRRGVTRWERSTV
jgi:site-specific DNA recombinase